jgi:drug/metabolite transporter (DMT)-like permease
VSTEATGGSEVASGRASRGSRRSLWLFVLASLAFGTGFVGIKTGLSDIPPLLFAALRYDVGAAVLLAYVAARGGQWVPRTRDDVAAVAVAGTFLSGLNAALLFLGQQYVTTGTAAVVFSIVPVLGALFAVLLLPGTRVDPVGLVGILLGLFGVTLIVGLSSLSADDGRTVLGVVLVGVSAATVAFGSVLLRRIRRRLPALSMTAWAMAAAAVLVHGLSLAAGERPADAVVSARAVAAVLWVGIPATAVAFPAYYGLIDRAGPMRANLISYTVPVVATVTGAVVLGEAVPPRTAVGFAVIVAGFVLTERRNLAVEVGRLRGPPDPPEAPEDHPCENAPRG